MALSHIFDTNERILIQRLYAHIHVYDFNFIKAVKITCIFTFPFRYDYN